MTEEMAAMAKRFIVACGGTGGHTFPGLAVAKELRARGHEVVVWVSGRSIESSVLAGWDGPTFSTRARPLHPKYFFSLLYSRFRCGREMKRFKPHALLAMGSYASLPPVLAASARRVPVILHEANTVPGRAVSYLSRYASVVALTFSETADFFRGRETVVTGLPVRGEIAGQPRFEDMPSDKFCVFVTGGSQGAHRVNEIASQALVLLRRDIERKGLKKMFQVIHQTGAADEAEVKARYEAAGIPARVNAFEHEMGRAFATVDVVVARAGASTCFEAQPPALQRAVVREGRRRGRGHTEGPRPACSRQLHPPQDSESRGACGEGAGHAQGRHAGRRRKGRGHRGAESAGLTPWPQTFFNFFSATPCARAGVLLHLRPSAESRAFRRGAEQLYSPSE